MATTRWACFYNIPCNLRATKQICSAQGILVLRDGAYLSEQDMFMKLEGVYLTSLGRLQAVMHPVHAIEQDLEQGDITEHSADYRYCPHHLYDTISARLPAGVTGCMTLHSLPQILPCILCMPLSKIHKRRKVISLGTTKAGGYAQCLYQNKPLSCPSQVDHAQQTASQVLSVVPS